MNKHNQRLFSLNQRKQLSIQTRKQYSTIICEKLFALDLKDDIMSYYPYNNEVDIIKFNIEKNVCYPVIQKDKTMKIYRPIDNKFLKNIYKIYEPDISTAIAIDNDSISTIIVPCVGFDEKGYRIGYGGGYYDRFLANINALKIGVCYEKTKVDQVDIDQHDIKLDMIITEENIYITN